MPSIRTPMLASRCSSSICLACAAVVLWGLPLAADPISFVSEASYTTLLSQLGTRNGDNRGVGGAQHDPAQTFIFNSLAADGLSPYLDSFVFGGSTYANVVGVLPGATHPNDIYIVGAHYDSAGTPGADDDASGVAGMLEAARVLSQTRFEDTIIFIGFDREEQGLIGSNAFAFAHRNDNILGMLSLDMIGWQDPAHPQSAFIYGGTAPGSALFDAALQNAFTNYGGGLTATLMGPNANSDNYSFERYGKPGALMIENYGSNPCYHRACDSIDTLNYIDYGFGTDMTRVAVGFVADIATETPEPDTAAIACVGLLVVFALRYSHQS